MVLISLLAALVAPFGAGAGTLAPTGHDDALAVSAFAPRSVTFISTQTGWALGTVGCASAGACLQLRATTDAGRTWSLRSLPAGLVAAADRKAAGIEADLSDGAGLDVRFADAQNGWIYGNLAVTTPQSGGALGALEPTFWSTHDGGRVWTKRSLAGSPSGATFDLEAGAGLVHLLWQNGGGRVRVESSPVTEDRWRDSSAGATLGNPAGGGNQLGSIVLEGSTGWLIEGNDRGTYGSARLGSDGRWHAWMTPPCSTVGGGFAVPAAATPSELVAICIMGGFAEPLSPAAPRGATLGSSWLYVSHDGGARFEAAHELGRQDTISFGSVLASPQPGVILTTRSEGSREQLIASFDGGADWRGVYTGAVTYLGFTTPSQGVALVAQSGMRTAMIMTFDAGRHWSQVRF